MKNQLALLKSKIESKKMLAALIKQLNKDFYMANIDFSIHENSSISELFNTLNAKIYQLYNVNYDAYLNLIYRVDVSEKSMMKIKLNELEEVIKNVTFLILEREFQKITLRLNYQ